MTLEEAARVAGRISEETEERRLALREMLDSFAWRMVARRAIEQQLTAIERRLATTRELPFEEVRRLQGEHAVWRRLQSQPFEALLGEEMGVRS